MSAGWCKSPPSSCAAVTKKEGSLAWRCPPNARGVTCQQKTHGSDSTEGDKRLKANVGTSQESTRQSAWRFVLSACLLCKGTGG